MAATAVWGEIFPRMAMRNAQNSIAMRSGISTARNIISAHRSISIASPRSLGLSAIAPKSPLQTVFQRRTLFGSSWGASSNRNTLAHLEQTANNNPGSATAQNAFYTALLRSNMPEIIAERHSTGRFATNSACDDVYKKALQQMGVADNGAMANAGGQAAQGNGMGNGISQSIGQAVAARYNGGNIGYGIRAGSGNGSTSEPIYVVVDESWGAYIFKWVKFALVFGICCYVTLVIISLVVETLGMMKKAGGSQNAETKPELQTTRFADSTLR